MGKFDDKVVLEEEFLEDNLQFNVEDKLARAGLRLGNVILDGIFINIIQAGLTFLLGHTLGFLGDAPVYSFLGFNVIYYTLFEHALGKTPAKFLTSTRVVDENGNQPTLQAILLRSLSRCIPFDAFSFLGERPVGWHDQFSKTFVIDEKKNA